MPKGFMEENTEYKDPDGDIAIIPEGFKISDDSKVIIDEGIVIEDENGNEFV